MKLSAQVKHKTLIEIFSEDHPVAYEINRCTGGRSRIQRIDDVLDPESMFQIFFEVKKIEETLNLARKILESSEGNTVAMSS